MIQLKQLLNESYIPGIPDYIIVAATLVGEAGGEGTNGMHAVKNVLQNRAIKRSSSEAGEALRPKQFSMWNSATSNVNVRSDFDPKKLQSVIDLYTGHSKWNEAVSMAKKHMKDITNGATLYYAHGKINPPSWTSRWTQTVVIGGHTFGKV